MSKAPRKYWMPTRGQALVRRKDINQTMVSLWESTPAWSSRSETWTGISVIWTISCNYWWLGPTPQSLSSELRGLVNSRLIYIFHEFQGTTLWEPLEQRNLLRALGMVVVRRVETVKPTAIMQSWRGWRQTQSTCPVRSPSELNPRQGG